jgi:hypothetical protein
VQRSIDQLDWHIESTDLISKAQVERSQFAAARAVKARVNV